MPGNVELPAGLCSFAEDLKAHVVQASGWVYMDETGRNRKYGYVGTEVGAQLTLRVDTTMGGKLGPDIGNVTLHIVYLATYENAGQAQFSCVSGCTCPAIIVDSLHEYQSSLITLRHMDLTPHADCIIQAELVPVVRPAPATPAVHGQVQAVLAGSTGAGAGPPSSAQKFKLMGLAMLGMGVRWVPRQDFMMAATEYGTLQDRNEAFDAELSQP